MKYTWLFDAGHGGIIDGKYQTKGKCSPDWELGVYYEGVGNRKFVNQIVYVLTKLGITAQTYIPQEREQEDIPLGERVRMINAIHTQKKNCVLVSVHSNAGGGIGFVVFTTKGQTKSDRFATVWVNEMKHLFPDDNFYEDQQDGDPDREENFYILKNSICPAILTENLFHDNKRDYLRLNDMATREKIALGHINMVLRMEGLPPLTWADFQLILDKPKIP